MFRLILNCLFGLAALGVAVGFLGWWVPLGDSLALLRPIFAVVCVIGMFALRPRWLRISAAAAALAGAVTILPVFVSQNGSGDLRLYSKNLWWANTQAIAIADDILAADVDVVMLQEVSGRNDDILSLLAADFPFQHRCVYSRWSDIAVLSTTPFEGAPVCSDRRALALAPIDVAGQKVWVASLHIPWPWPYDSAGHETEAAALLSGLDAPVVVAGDFNMFPWTARVRRIAEAGQTRLAGPSRPTLTLRHLPMMIDHVLAPGGGQVERRPLLGSDHRGLVADVAF